MDAQGHGETPGGEGVRAQVVRPQLRVIGTDADTTQVAKVIVRPVERDIDSLWDLMTSKVCLQRWLGLHGRPGPGVPFASPVAPQFVGKVRAVVAEEPTTKSLYLDIADRTVRIALNRTGEHTTSVYVEDPHGFQTETRKAWANVLGEISDCHIAITQQPIRQAVIVVHGIGEQRRGKTIETFIDKILPSCRETLTSQPVRMHDGSEMRRYRTAAGDGEDGRRPSTDFYEYYWAHHAEGTRVQHVVAWTFSLLMRNPRKLNTGTRNVWLMGWAMLCMVLLAIPAYRLAPSFGRTVLAIIAAGLVIAALAAIGFLRNFLGDAARYLGTAPYNVTLRERIRAEGVQLLRALHESGEYDRIVLAGHSLGTVVGYDMLRDYWAEVSDIHRSPAATDQPALKSYLKAMISGKGIHQDEQRALWAEQRANGNPWLVTDFVTFGSPLAHAQLVLSDSGDDFLRRKRLLELPTCPPTPELLIDADGDQAQLVHKEVRYRVGAETTSLQLLHHGAAFAPTRWTNLYYQGRFAGDPIGGPLAPEFGVGIDDITVVPGWDPRFWGILGHSKYAEGPALSKLREALGLADQSALEELRERLPLAERLRS